MANEDLLTLDEQELGRTRREIKLYPGLTPDIMDRLVAINERMAALGFWHCDHCDFVTILPSCTICARESVDQVDHY